MITTDELTPEMFSMEMTTEARATWLADEAIWAVEAGFFDFAEDGGVMFADYGRLAVGFARSVMAQDCDDARESDVYVNGLRLHWLVVAFATGEPVEAVDQPVDQIVAPTRPDNADRLYAAVLDHIHVE